METILLIVVVGALIIVAFFIGAKVGQKVSNNEPIKLPTINPMTIYKQKEEKKEVEDNMRAMNIMLENIDNYGTEKKQQEIK